MWFWIVGLPTHFNVIFIYYYTFIVNTQINKINCTLHIIHNIILYVQRNRKHYYTRYLVVISEFGFEEKKLDCSAIN